MALHIIPALKNVYNSVYEMHVDFSKLPQRSHFVMSFYHPHLVPFLSTVSPYQSQCLCLSLPLRHENLSVLYLYYNQTQPLNCNFSHSLLYLCDNLFFEVTINLFTLTPFSRTIIVALIHHNKKLLMFPLQQNLLSRQQEDSPLPSCCPNPRD